MLSPYKIRGGLLLPGVIYRVRGTKRQLCGIGFERFDDFGYAALELRVATGDDGRGIIFHDDIRIDAMAFDDVFPVGRGAGEFGHENGAAIQERAAASDADHSSPSALADQWTETSLAEHVRKDITIGCGRFVDEADFGSVKHSEGISARVVRDPIEIGAEQLAAKALNQHRRNVAAAVAAAVNDQAS